MKLVFWLVPCLPIDLEANWSLEERLGRAAVVLRGWDGVGFNAQFVHLFEDDLTVVVLSNLNMSSISSEVADNVVALALGEPYQPLRLVEQPTQSAEELHEFAGLYRFGSDFFVPGTTMRIAVRDGQLVVPEVGTVPEGGLLALVDGSFIYRQQWVRVSFEWEGDGGVTSMRYGSFRAMKEPEECLISRMEPLPSSSSNDCAESYRHP